VRGRLALGALCGLVPMAVLAPLLGRGFLLSYDMVFVPRQTLRPSDIGLGTALPRAVPSDAAVSLASAVLPGDVLQQLVLFLLLGLGALGAGLVLPATAPLGRCVAALAYIWNPYVAERLVQGHWALLVGYAALPWVLRAALAVRAGTPGGRPRLVLTTAVAAITPTGGLLAAALAAAVLVRAPRAEGSRVRIPPVAAFLLAAAVLNGPWIVPGLLHPAGSGSDPAGVDAFAARAENWSGTLGSLLGLGGIWNAGAVPASRTTVVAPLLSLLLLALAVAGLPALRRNLGGGAPLWVAAAGLLVAAAGAVEPGRVVLRALVEHVAGAGLLRDGQKLLAPLALVLALGAGLGAERVLRRVRQVGARPTVAALLLALPVVTTPDLAWGAGLRPVHYPADWATVRAALDGPGDMVVLPYSAFRAFDWTGGRTVLDPAPRAFDRTVVVDDTLVVGGTVIAGEDRRAGAVRAALAAGEPLGPLGIGWVLVERGTPGEVVVPAAAVPVHLGPDLELYRLPDYRPADLPRPPVAPVLLADLLAVGLVLGAAAVRARGRMRSRTAATGW